MNATDVFVFSGHPHGGLYKASGHGSINWLYTRQSVSEKRKETVKQ